MRVIVRRSPLERLIDVIERLELQGKQVDRVEVTAAEYEELLNCPIGPNKDDPSGQLSCFKDRELYVRGVRIVAVSTAKVAEPDGIEIMGA